MKIETEKHSRETIKVTGDRERLNIVINIYVWGGRMAGWMNELDELNSASANVYDGTFAITTTKQMYENKIDNKIRKIKKH